MSSLSNEEKKEILLGRISSCDHHIMSLIEWINDPDKFDVPGKKSRAEQLADWQAKKEAIISEYNAID